MREASTDPRVVTEIYKPFFLAGILAVLTAGCLLGAIALLGVALQGSYTAHVWTPYVLAHANSQLYGWVGFFVMGFALQQHAPRLSRERVFQRLAKSALILMALGIGIRFAAEPLAQADPSVWMPVGVFSCILQAVAVAIFLFIPGVTRFKTGEGLTWQTAFVFASLIWWMAVAIAEPIFFAKSHAPDGVMFVAEWFSPYREAQFLGFVTMMIFGVAFVKMHSCFGAKQAHSSLGIAGFVLWNAGLVARMAGWIVNFRSGMTDPFLWHVGGVALACGAVLLLGASRMFEPLTNRIRSHKFVRGAFGWLAISGLLLLLEPLHLRMIGMPFSHAYTGAIRHAITVGFISQMIIGVSIHVVARMNDLDSEGLAPLWSVFWLLNIGNAMRVTLEIATDYTSRAFLPMGVTGFIELTGLIIRAANVARPMLRRTALSHV